MLNKVQESFFHLLPSNFALLFNLSKKVQNSLVNSIVLMGTLFYVVGDYLRIGADERKATLNTRLDKQEEVLEALYLYI